MRDIKFPNILFQLAHCLHINLEFLFNTTVASIGLYCMSIKHYCWICGD